jgi:hypothetical protein
LTPPRSSVACGNFGDRDAIEVSMKLVLQTAPVSSSLPDGLLVQLDGDEADSRRAIGLVSMLGTAAPELLAPMGPKLVDHLFGAAPIGRRLALAAALSPLPFVSTATLLWQLGAHDAETRAVAAAALGAPRHACAVPALSARLLDGREVVDVRRTCADALATIGDRGGLPAALQALTDPNAALRVSAVRAVSAIAGLQGGRRLLLATRDGDARVRKAAMVAFLDLGGPGARTAARRALDDASPEVRAIAVLTLARHGGAADAPALERAADDPDRRVRRAAAARAS